MTAEQEINLMTFPEEWTAMLERSKQPMHHNAGRGGAYSWESPRKTASFDDSKDRGEKNKNRGEERTWRDRHPDRYGPMAINPHTPKTLFHLMERFRDDKGNLSMKKVVNAAKTTWAKIGKGAICANYACGCCNYTNCRAAHLYEREMPKGYAKFLYDELHPGVVYLINRQESPPKRRRGETDDANAGDGATP